MLNSTGRGGKCMRDQWELVLNIHIRGMPANAHALSCFLFYIYFIFAARCLVAFMIFQEVECKMFSHFTKTQTCSPAMLFSKRQLSPEESSQVLVSIIDCMLLLACAALCWLPIPSPFPYFTPLVCFLSEHQPSEAEVFIPPALAIKDPRCQR